MKITQLHIFQVINELENLLLDKENTLDNEAKNSDSDSVYLREHLKGQSWGVNKARLIAIPFLKENLLKDDGI